MLSPRPKLAYKSQRSKIPKASVRLVVAVVAARGCYRCLIDTDTDRGPHMTNITRRKALKAGMLGALAGVAGPRSPRARAQDKQPLRYKLGTDLPVTHSVNVRL